MAVSGYWAIRHARRLYPFNSRRAVEVDEAEVVMLAWSLSEAAGARKKMQEVAYDQLLSSSYLDTEHLFTQTHLAQHLHLLPDIRKCHGSTQACIPAPVSSMGKRPTPHCQIVTTPRNVQTARQLITQGFDAHRGDWVCTTITRGVPVLSEDVEEGVQGLTAY